MSLAYVPYKTRETTFLLKTSQTRIIGGSAYFSEISREVSVIYPSNEITEQRKLQNLDSSNQPGVAKPVYQSIGEAEAPTPSSQIGVR